MIGRLAFRSLTAHPLRSMVLSAGFGVGVAVMAILLGVAEIVLEQAQSPALVGGGDVLIRMNPQVPARLVLSGTLQSDTLRSRVRVAAPFHTTNLYLVRADGTTARVAARGGIPSLERALGDPETGHVDAWRDSPSDEAWTRETPDRALRQIDRFHQVPHAPRWESSWAEWLYFNGRAGNTRFYLTFIVGPYTPEGGRTAAVRLQLERNGAMTSYGTSDVLTDEEVARAPDLAIGRSSVRLDGLQYRIHLDVADDEGRPVRGDLTLQASPGRLVPPFEVGGAQGWVTGYVVPVMSGRLTGTLDVDGAEVSLDGGTGYHDHNWGFWEGVSWQWGQVQHGDMAFLYGRVFPPREAADPERFPGFVGALGPGGPLGYTTDVQISETNDAQGAPRQIVIRGRGSALDLSIQFDVASATVSRMEEGPLGNGVNFLQLRGTYAVSGHVGATEIAFEAEGAAETFRERR